MATVCGSCVDGRRSQRGARVLGRAQVVGRGCGNGSGAGARARSADYADGDRWGDVERSRRGVADDTLCREVT